MWIASFSKDAADSQWTVYKRVRRACFLSSDAWERSCLSSALNSVVSALKNVSLESLLYTLLSVNLLLSFVLRSDRVFSFNWYLVLEIFWQMTLILYYVINLTKLDNDSIALSSVQTFRYNISLLVSIITVKVGFSIHSELGCAALH